MMNTDQNEREVDGMQKTKKKTESSYTKGQRIAALVAVVLLVGMYLVTLAAAIFTSPAAPELFKMCIGSTILLPIMFWLYIQFWKMFTKRPEIPGENEKNIRDIAEGNRKNDGN